MKRNLLLLVVLLIGTEGFAQKFSLGVLAGISQNYEFTRRINPHTSFTPPYSKNTVDNALNPTFGIFGAYTINKKHKVELEVRYRKIVQQQTGDFRRLYLNTTITPYYAYTITPRWSAAIGIYYNLLLATGIIEGENPGPSTSSPYIYPGFASNNTYGGTLKVAYRLKRVSIEGGFMAPITSYSKNDYIAYYIPTSFIQLKYDFLK